MTQEPSSPVQTEKSPRETSLTDSVLNFVRDSRWLLLLFGFDLVLAALGFAVDKWAGPLTPQSELTHQVAALLGAVSAVLFVTLSGLLVLWTGLVANEARYR